MENDNNTNTSTPAAGGEQTPAAGAQAPGTTSFLTGDENAKAADKPAADATANDDKSGGKAGEGDQPAVEYKDFTLPEGVTLDAELLEQAAPIFKELGLSKEQAQKFVDLKAKEAKSQADAFNQQLEGWKTSAQSDKEYGGDNFNQNIAVAQSALNKFGTPELKQLLGDSGLGNHPEVIRLMVRVGKLTTEDNPSKGQPSKGAQQDHAAILYPNENKA